MPTGYTYPVVEGNVTEFNDFAMSCARAFGALITMRDDPMDAPIPDEFTPSTEYDNLISTDSKLMGQIQAMTNAEAEAAAQDAHAEALKDRAKYLENKELEASRLNSMLMKVCAWQPPTPDHNEMKEFMIEQLTISMPGSYAPSIPAAMDGATWRKTELDRLAESVVRNRQDRDKEINRAASRTKWVNALRQSLTAQNKAA